MTILDDFQQWLKSKGYTELTEKGNPSTVYDYAKRVENVCKNENISLEELIKNIDTIVTKYNLGGEKEEAGQASHAAVINALKRFKEFLEDQK